MLRTCHKEDFFVCLPSHSCALSECFTPMSLMLSNNFCGESLPIFVGSVSCRKRHNNLDNEMCLERYQNMVPPDKEYYSAYVKIYLPSNVILFIHVIITLKSLRRGLQYTICTTTHILLLEIWLKIQILRW